MGGLMASPTGYANNPPSANLSGLLNTGSNYSFPLTSGLLNSVAPPASPPQTQLPQGSLGTSPAGVPNYSEIALQMAGNPKAGPLAPVPVPSGTGIPGTSTGGGGGKGSGPLGGLLGAMIQNPSLTKNLVSSATNAISGLMSPGAASLAAAPAADAAATGATAYGADLAAETAAPAAADASASVGAGASGGLMAGLGPALAIAAPLGLMAYAMSTPPVTYGKGYYDNAANTLKAGYNVGQPGFPLLNQAMVNPSGLAPGMWSVLNQAGITPSNIQQVYKQATSGPLPASVGVGGGRNGTQPV